MTERSKKLLAKTRKRRSKEEKFQEQFYYASQFKMMQIKFRKHKLARVSLYVLFCMYAVAIFADFLAPYPKSHRLKEMQFRPPTRIRIFDADRRFVRPFVYGLKKELDRKTFKYHYAEDVSTKLDIKLLIESEPYKLLGVFSATRKLFGVEDGIITLFGTDKLGMDIFSQTLYASRISLFVGLVGVIISFVIGIVLGGISGYFGGIVDDVIQRIIELVISIPQLPLWIALSAAIPKHWSGAKTFLAITIILSFVGWTGLARVVRGRLIAMREEEFVLAAKVAGAKDATIIRQHLLPGFMSYLIVHATLAIPQMILGETTLSFLGLGILPPEVSWGAQLRDAQQITMISNYPWYLIPCIFIVVTVLLYNFIGDGLRDAADPYR